MPPSFSSGLRIRPPGQVSSLTYTVTPQAVPVREPVKEGIQRCAPGPWGEIEFHHIYLEASEQVVSRFRMPGSQPIWAFPGHTLQSLEELFERARIPADWLDYWLKPPCLVEMGATLNILVPIQHLDALMPEQRAMIFAELAKHEVNEYHRDPVFITSGSVEEFLRYAELSNEDARWFARACYRRGKVLCFSDVRALVARARSATEAVRFMKLCTRTRAIIARLRVTEQTDINELISYWTNEERRKDMRPLLHSIAAQRTCIDIAHLLPPLARKLLNGYPPFELAVKGRMPDCHWSSLNFFNYEPRDYYLDTRLAASHVLENYDQVEAPYRYGDKLLFLNDSQQAFHSCVYIAGDIVFSKNGDNAANPWILTHLGDLEQIYLSGTAGRVQGFRIRHK